MTRQPIIWALINWESELKKEEGDLFTQSVVGAQQDDSAGPQPIVETLTPDLNVWYLDGTIGDCENVVFENFKQTIDQSKMFGLEINPSKCELFFSLGSIDKYSGGKIRISITGIRVVNRSKLAIFGSPVFEEGFLDAAHQKIAMT